MYSLENVMGIGSLVNFVRDDIFLRQRLLAMECSGIGGVVYPH